MSKHTLQVFLYELRRNFRRRGYLFTTFGVPLIGIALLLGYQFISSRSADDTSTTGGSSDIPGLNMPVSPSDMRVEHAGYVDETGLFSDPGGLSRQLTPYPDEAAAQAALDAGDIPIYYLIPVNYMETGDITVVMPRLNLSQMDTGLIRPLLLNTLTEGVDEDRLQRLVNPTNFQITNYSLTISDPGGSGGEGASFVLVYVFAIALLMSLFVTNGYLMQSVIEEKETRLIEILVATVRPIQLLTGKILAMGLLGLLQISAWVGGMILAVQLVGASEAAGAALGALATLANIQLPLHILPLLLLYFLLAYLLFAALYGVVGAMSNSMREGPQYAVVFTLPAVIPLYFTGIFSSTPDAPLPTILSLIPITAPLGMTQRLLISDVPGWQVALSLGLLAVTCVVVLWLAGRVFRVQTLLAGQAPKLRDLPRLIRG